MNSQGTSLRWLVGLLSLTGLVIVFLFQRWDAAAFLGVSGNNLTHFLVNRSIRFLLNDALAVGLIYALFPERKYMLFALIIQVVGMFLILIPYFVVKINYPSYNGPMISFLHRLVLNPTLLLLLIPAFYIQRRQEQHG